MDITAAARTDLKSRIDAMFAIDRLWAWGFVAALWLVVAFVYFAISAIVVDDAIRIVLAIAALAVVVFNTASIGAMIRHYAHDKEHIYGADIRHLDANRAARAGGTVPASRAAE